VGIRREPLAHFISAFGLHERFGRKVSPGGAGFVSAPAGETPRTSRYYARFRADGSPIRVTFAPFDL